MPDYLLDTNILSYWYDSRRREHRNVMGCVSSVRQPDSHTGYTSRLFISVVTLGEIEYGHRVHPSPDTSQQTAFLSFVRKELPEPLEITKHVTEQYGELRAWLFSNCSPKTNRTKARRVEELIDPTTARELAVQENDVWIAAQAMTHNLTLVTHDSCGNFGKLLRQFAATLNVQDWSESLGKGSL